MVGEREAIGAGVTLTGFFIWTSLFAVVLNLIGYPGSLVEEVASSVFVGAVGGINSLAAAYVGVYLMELYRGRGSDTSTTEEAGRGAETE